MGRYILNRLWRSLISLVIVLFAVVLLVYSLMDRNAIFIKDTGYTNKSGNEAIDYKYGKWESYGYLDKIEMLDYCSITYPGGEDNLDYLSCVRLPLTQGEFANHRDSLNFKAMYEEKGYSVIFLPATSTQGSYLFAVKDYSPFYRLWNFFKNLIVIDNVNYVPATEDIERYIRVEKDPLSNNMPAVVCSGCKNKYLVYFDDTFPFIHQNWIRLNLGISTYPNEGADIFELWTENQGPQVNEEIQYPKDIVNNTGKYYNSPENLHNCTYVSILSDDQKSKFLDHYAFCDVNLKNPSRIGYSFILGIIATIITYILGVPLGILMAKNKNGIIDKLGIIYIVIIMAVPALAYIFLFQRLGNKMGLPTGFNQADSFPTWMLYVLPVISLVIPSIAGVMKWIRRYMIDQMNSDYVKFARAKGLSEGEIFNKHIFKNASIPIVHGIPASILGCLTGSLFTEKVYGVPGIGQEFTKAIEANNNSVILALTLFFASLSIISLILGDVLMAIVDPRISFSNSGGGRK